MAIQSFDQAVYATMRRLHADKKGLPSAVKTYIRGTRYSPELVAQLALDWYLEDDLREDAGCI